jgi:hypothetical protein
MATAPAAPLELTPVAGFANRLRAMASAAAAARDLGRPLVIRWTQQMGICVGEAKNLFDVHALRGVQLLEEGFEVPSANPPRQILSPADWSTICETPPAQPIRIKSYGVFYCPDKAAWLAALRSFAPHPLLSHAVQRFLATQRPAASPPFVGVHIRRTDNEKSIQLSPTAAFLDAMYAYPPETHFFLATDDAREREQLIAAFGDRIHFGATKLSRSSEEGLIHAAFDFFALARCSEILGSAGSSFSELAAAYGGCPLRVIRDA